MGALPALPPRTGYVATTPAGHSRPLLLALPRREWPCSEDYAAAFRAELVCEVLEFSIAAEAIREQRLRPPNIANCAAVRKITFSHRRIFTLPN